MKLTQLSQRLQMLTVDHSAVQQWPPKPNEKSAIFCDNDASCVALISDCHRTNFIDRGVCELNDGIGSEELIPFLRADYKTVIIKPDMDDDGGLDLTSFQYNLQAALWDGNFG